MTRKLYKSDLDALAGYLFLFPRNQSQIARHLGISLGSVYSKIKQVERYWLLNIVRQPRGSHIPNTYQVIRKRPDA